MIEQVLFSLRAGHSVFTDGAFGAAADGAINLLEGREWPDFTWEFQKGAPHAEEMRVCFLTEGGDSAAMAAWFLDFAVGESARQYLAS